MTRLDDIKAREAEATEGPWAYTGKERCGPDDSLVVYPVEEGGAIAYVQPLHADAAFIAHAREDIPWLVERIEAVLALHRPRSGYIAAATTTGVPMYPTRTCTQCQVAYPCPTVRALGVES